MILKRLLHHKLPYKPIVDLAFTHAKPPKPTGSSATKPPVILTLHGLFGSKNNFSLVNKYLAKDFSTDVYAVDLRNHGTSPRAKPYDYLTMARDLIHFVNTHIDPLRSVNIVGFSLGGKIALTMALSKKINVEKCVSVDIPPYCTPGLDDVLLQNYDKIMQISGREIKIEKGTKKWKEKLISEFRKVPVNVDDKLVLYFANGFFQVKNNNCPYIQGKDADPYVNHTMDVLDMPDLLDQVKAWPDFKKTSPLEFRYQTNTEVLFMRGLKSEFITDDYSRLGVQFPNFTVKEFDSRHNIIGESPVQFYDCLKEFLSQVSVPRC